VEAAEDSLVGEGSGRGRRPSLIGKREGLVPAVCGVGEGGEPTWVSVAVSEEKARVLTGLAKGVEVYVEGRLSLNTWTGRDGAERTGLSVSAWRVEVLGGLRLATR
jgi:hypothetical protein